MGRPLGSYCPHKCTAYLDPMSQWVRIACPESLSTKQTSSLSLRSRDGDSTEVDRYMCNMLHYLGNKFAQIFEVSDGPLS